MQTGGLLGCATIQKQLANWLFCLSISAIFQREKQVDFTKMQTVNNYAYWGRITYGYIITGLKRHAFRQSE